MTRTLRMGMFGGGKGAFIGAIHRCAAFMDNQIELVCGCFSSNPEKSLESGRELMLDDSRIYSTYQEMIEKEAMLPEEQRMDFMSIVTPNHLHFGPAKMALENGFDVVLDKPMTFSLAEAKELRETVQRTGRILARQATQAGEQTRQDLARQAAWVISEHMPFILRNIFPA